MLVVKNNDLVSVKLETLLADYDRETISNLYMPIIGYQALAIFFTLWGEANNQKITSIISHEDLLTRMGMNMTDFISGRRKLEGVGLLITKMEKGNDISVYHYHIYAPKTPYEFFDDTLLYGLLIKAIGEVNASRLKGIYHLNKDDNSGEDITSSFGEVFHPDYGDEVFAKVANSSSGSVGRKRTKIALEFSYETFFNELKIISQISETAFSKQDMKEISRLASLYGANENVAASIVAAIYDSNQEKGKRLDFEKVNKCFQDETNYKFLSKKKKIDKDKNLSSGDSDLANKVNLMETIAPKDYLAVLANGTKPCIADLKIIDSLSRDYHLPNSVINVLVEFVLVMNDNILSKSYAEKVAASLARSNIETAIDAMNYLTNHQNKKNNKNYTKSNKGGLKLEPKIEKEKIKEGNLDDEWDALLEDLENTEDGKD